MRKATKMTTRNRVTNLRSAACFVGLAGFFLFHTSAATAQDALGAGDALDANLSLQGTRNTPTPNAAAAYRVRNLLVTGDIAGGREFRDSVGYTAAEDFRGALGSDDTFRFRADSAFSAPNYILYKDPLTELRIGQDLGLAAEFRRDSTPYIQSGVQSTFIPQNQNMVTANMLRLDRLLTDVSLSEDIERASESRPIGIATTSEGQTIVPMTTSILGIQTMTMAEAQRTAGMSVLDRTVMREQFEEKMQQLQQVPGSTLPVQPYTESFSDLMKNVPNRLQHEPAESRLDPKDQSYETLMREVAQRFAGAEQLSEEKLTELDEQYDELKKYLSGDEWGAESTEEVPDEGESPESAQPGQQNPAELPVLPGMETPAEDPTQPPLVVGPSRDVTPTLESFGIALQHGQQVSTYATGQDERFNELIKSAEESMATGEYFWAERRFVRALRFQPNHPLATAGRGHSQLGAGLYLPAALTLKFVLIRYPELIDVRYDAGLLPTPVRLDENIAAIRERLQQGADGAEMGFLLAYIGHQQNDQALMNDGIDALEENAPTDRLLPLLKRVWLGESTKPAGDATPNK